MTSNEKKPEWAPDDAGPEFTTRVTDGVKGGHDGRPGCLGMEIPSPTVRPPGPRRKKLTVDDYVQGVLAGDRTIMGRAITLVESNSPAHLEQAQEMLGRLLPHTGQSIRVGITGYPGAGKSTFIETLGNLLCDQGRRVAVLAVDPSSGLTKGSILGDKTRMEKLSNRPEAFIRPSPSSGILGGVARKSRETILVCEAAGYDVVLVETVGVGQSETTVRSMVDFFLLVIIPGAGDELQGIKRGIMELTDAIAVNKADGDNKIRAEITRAEFAQALPYLQPATEGWVVKAVTCSAKTREGVPELWEVVEEFRRQTTESGVLEERRRRQNLTWVRTLVSEHLETSFWGHPAVKKLMPQLEGRIKNGEISPTLAADRLVKIFEEAS